MQILIFGGTTEGRRLSHALAEKGMTVTVCVATAYGTEEQGQEENITVLEGRKDFSEMKKLLRTHTLCIDATHPYAVEVTKNIQLACAAEDIPYLRLLREKSAAVAGAVYVDSAAEAAAFLGKTEGNILLTTGAKEISAFASLERKRLYPRILPAAENLALCEKEGIPKRNIIAMQGPFGQALNEALMEQFDIRYMVTKDGGTVGGFPEKIEAARKQGVQAIILRRPLEEGKTYAKIMQFCEERMKCR